VLTVSTGSSTLNAINNLASTQRSLATTFSHLSSGKRIAKATDDASGLGVAEKLRARSASAQQAMRNTNDGASIAQTAEGSMDEVMNILVRLRELAVQSSSDTLASTERSYLVKEAAQLTNEVDRIAQVTEFNGLKLTNGDNSTIEVQVGIMDTTNDRISLTFGNLTTSSLGISTLAVTTGGGLALSSTAQDAITTIDSAINTVNGYRSDLGASQNRLDTTLSMLEGMDENLQGAESVIRDADFAYETAQLSKYQVLTQSGIAVLAQAKGMSQNVISLLQ